MLKNSASTLFVPQRIRELSPGGEMVPYFSNSSEVFITRNLQAGDTYTVTAPLYSSEDPGIGLLLEACAAYDDPEWDNLPDIYTALPDHLESPLFDLANEITEHARTPYDKAIAIQNWLTRNFRYTLDVGEHPENIDFVTSFLLDTRKGYCTYFASAMTVLCRMAGLPARYVEGYLAVPNAQGEALVTGKDAHAWTEIYFKGFGWLTFDATPKQRMSNSQDGGEGTPEDDPAQNIPEKGPDTTPEPESIEPTQTPIPPENTDEPAIPEQDPAHNDDKQPDADRDEETPPDTEPVSSVSGTFPWWVLVLLVLIIAFGLRIVLTSPSVRASHTKSEEKKLEIWIQEIFDLLAAEHLTRRKGETPMGFTRRVDRLGYFSTVTTPVGECLSLIRYSRAEPVEADTCMVRDTAVLLRPDISRPAQVRYWVRRIFLPPKRRDWRKS